VSRWPRGRPRPLSNPSIGCPVVPSTVHSDGHTGVAAAPVSPDAPSWHRWNTADDWREPARADTLCRHVMSISENRADIKIRSHSAKPEYPFGFPLTNFFEFFKTIFTKCSIIIFYLQKTFFYTLHTTNIYFCYNYLLFAILMQNQVFFVL
jgi:hypothetical protein